MGGTCKPCAWFQKSPSQCRKGSKCLYCHVCLPGELKRRKQEKLLRQASRQLFQRELACSQDRNASLLRLESVKEEANSSISAQVHFRNSDSDGGFGHSAAAPSAETTP